MAENEATPCKAALEAWSETVLVTDDQPVVLHCVAEALRESGYRVLEAKGGEQALAVARTHPGPIHLLLTDVTMPGLSGPDLAARLSLQRPELRVLFMTADPANDVPAGRPQTRALGKPFVLDDLDHAVRDALGPAPSPAGRPTPG